MLAIAGVPRQILPAFLKTTAEEYSRERVNYRPSTTTITPLLDGHLNCFVGDSHAEFYARAYASARSNELWDPIAFWLGSKTLLGYVSVAARRQLMTRLQTQLQPFLKANGAGRNSIAICWTLGSIDVRSAFHELMVRGAANDIGDVTALFEQTLSSLVQEVVLPFQRLVADDCPDVAVRSFFVSAICPTTPEIRVSTGREVARARKQHSAPTFGSLADRRAWTVAVNGAIEAICATNGILYYDSGAWIAEGEAEAAGSVDQVHLTDPSAIRNMNEQIAIATHAA